MDTKPGSHNPFTACAMGVDKCAAYSICRGAGQCLECPDPTLYKPVFTQADRNAEALKRAKSGEFDTKPGCEPMPANPKQIYGDKKVPLHLFPTTAIAVGCMAFLEGREKYGDNNFRAAPVEAMTYVRACDSHMKAWAEGRDTDPDSGLPELGKALACIAILIDAQAAGTLIDNRKFNGNGYINLLGILEPQVARIRDLHADKNPRHYTIADNGKV